MWSPAAFDKRIFSHGSSGCNRQVPCNGRRLPSIPDLQTDASLAPELYPPDSDQDLKVSPEPEMHMLTCPESRRMLNWSSKRRRARSKRRPQFPQLFTLSISFQGALMLHRSCRLGADRKRSPKEIFARVAMETGDPLRAVEFRTKLSRPEDNFE